MANISAQIAKIMEAVYGEEVRGSIKDALLAMNDESSQAMSDASLAKDSAKNSAAASAASAANAKTSETKAAGSADNAKGYAETASQKANEASTSAANAKNSEAKAEDAAQTAGQKAEEALSSATNAKNSETKANTSATNAKNSENNAKTSETKATDSANSAKGYADTASQKADEASISAANAKNSETKAEDAAARAQAISGGDFLPLTGGTVDGDVKIAGKHILTAYRIEGNNNLHLAAGPMDDGKFVELEFVVKPDSGGINLLNGGLDIDGGMNIKNGLRVHNGITVYGNVSVNGGGDFSNPVTITDTLSTHTIKPLEDLEYNLGSKGSAGNFRYKTIYAGTIDAESIVGEATNGYIKVLSDPPITAEEMDTAAEWRNKGACVSYSWSETEKVIIPNHPMECGMLLNLPCGKYDVAQLWLPTGYLKTSKAYIRYGNSARNWDLNWKALAWDEEKADVKHAHSEYLPMYSYSGGLDFNSLKASGIYFINTKSITNAPNQNTGVLLVDFDSPYMKFQLYIQANSGIRYRIYAPSSDSWSEWTLIFDDSAFFKKDNIRIQSADISAGSSLTAGSIVMVYE